MPPKRKAEVIVEIANKEVVTKPTKTSKAESVKSASIEFCKS